MPLIYLVGHFVVGMHESGWSSSYQQQPQSFNKNLRLLVLVVTCLLSHFVGVQIKSTGAVVGINLKLFFFLKIRKHNFLL